MKDPCEMFVVVVGGWRVEMLVVVVGGWRDVRWC